MAFGQLVFPNTEDTPPCPAQGLVHKPVTGLVAGKFLLPKRTVAGGLRAMLGTIMPEAAIHKNREPRLPENKIRPNTKTGRAVLPRRRDIWAAQQRGPTSNLNVPPPAGNFVPTQQFCQRQFRVLVPAPANPRHHLRPLRLGENITSLFCQSSCHPHQESNRPAKRPPAKCNLPPSSHLRNRARLPEIDVIFPSHHRRFHAGQLQKSDIQPASDFRRAMPESVLRKPYQ